MLGLRDYVVNDLLRRVRKVVGARGTIDAMECHERNEDRDRCNGEALEAKKSGRDRRAGPVTSGTTCNCFGTTSIANCRFDVGVVCGNSCAGRLHRLTWAVKLIGERKRDDAGQANSNIPANRGPDCAPSNVAGNVANGCTRHYGTNGPTSDHGGYPRDDGRTGESGARQAKRVPNP
jgi:hypothetical protein